MNKILRDWSVAASDDWPAEIRVGEMVIDMTRFVVRTARRALPLTKLEFDLLRYLAVNSQRVITYAELMERVVGTAYRTDSSLLRVHISRLRRKLGAAGSAIQTVRARGFCFDCGYLESAPRGAEP